MIFEILSFEEARRGGPPRWVNGQTYKTGQCTRSPSDHQRYVRITDGGGAVDPASDTTNWRPDGGRPIKSIQRGTLTVSGNSPSATATISAVNTAKAELRFLGMNPISSSAINEGMVYIVLTNSTTITAARQWAGNSNMAIVSWELTEYY